MSFEKRKCPYCDNAQCEAEWTDVGIGFVQHGPYHCEACGAFEVGPYDNASLSETESDAGWYQPNRAELPSSVSSINGKFLNAATALALYARGLVPHVPFQLTAPQDAVGKLMAGTAVLADFALG